MLNKFIQPNGNSLLLKGKGSQHRLLMTTFDKKEGDYASN